MPLDIRSRFGRAILLIAANSLLLETTLGLTRKAHPWASRRGLPVGGRFVTSALPVIQEQFGRGQLLRYCHVSASYCISTLPLGNVVENERGCLSRA